MNTLITPKVKTTIQNINGFKIRITELILNEYANIEVQLFNDTSLVDITFIKLEGDDYLNWGINDDYIIDYVRNWLNAI